MLNFFSKGFLVKNSTIFSLVVLVSQLFLVISISLQPIPVEASSYAWTGNGQEKIITQNGSNQFFRDHLSAGFGYNYELNYSLIKFDAPSLPSGAIITSARLELFQYSESMTGFGHNVYASVLAGDWSTGGTNSWGSPGFVANSNQVYSAPGSHAVNIDITGFLQNGDYANRIANYGIALRSPSTGSGGSYCSSRNDSSTLNGGSPTWCGANSYPKIAIEYTLNNPPNIPVLDSNFLSSNDAHGGESYIGGVVRENNPATTADDLTQNCVKNSGCNVRIRFGNFGDPDAAPWQYVSSTIFFEANVPPGGSAVVGTSKTVGWGSTADFDQAVFLSDGYYRVYASSVDGLGAVSNSNSAFVKVDTTAPLPVTIQNLAEFSAGDQLMVNANSVGDTNSLSNPTKYDFCRTDGLDPNSSTTFAGGTSATATDSDFVHCSSSGDAGPNAPGMWQDSSFFGFGQLEDNKKYFFTVRAKDTVDPSKPDRANKTNFSAPVGTIMDATAPVISAKTLRQNSTDLNSLRLSTANQDGVNDSTQVVWTVDELNLGRVEYQLKNLISGNVVATYPVFDFANGLDKTTSKNGISSNFDEIFAGLSETSQTIADGTYQVVIAAKDKAGNETKNDELVITIDNTPGQINISTPPQNTFTNKPEIEIAGQVFSQDLVSLEECQKTNNQCNFANLDFFNLQNEDYFFKKNYSLNLGNNLFAFRSTDSVKNIQEKELTVIRETEIPAVDSIQFDTQNIPVSGENILSKNRRPNISFVISDPNLAGNGQSGIDNASINLKLVNSKNEEVSLVINGANSSPLGSFTTTCTDVDNGAGNFVTGQPSCSINYNFTSDIQPDGQWKFVLIGKDKAGNDFSNDGVILNLDSHTFLQNSLPGEGSIFARKKVRFEGRGEQGATLKLTNDRLQALSLSEETYGVKVVLDEANSGSFGQTLSGANIDSLTSDSYIQSSFNIVCNEEQDFDNSDLTTNPICTWSVDLLQDSISDPLATNPTVINKNQISITDTAGNTLNQTKTISVNLFAVDLAWYADENAGKQYGTNFISTDGNGRQDGIYFQASASNPNNPDDGILVDKWKFVIKNQNGEIVRTISGANSLPPATIFDGKDDNGNWLLDGNYVWEFDLDTVDNSNLPLLSGAFSNITTATAGVFITYPSGATANSPFITTKGVLEVQGQANLFAGQNLEDVQVRVCVDTVGLPSSCDYEQVVSVDKSGFFSSIVGLPKISSDPNNPGITNHIIQATIVDKFGNEGIPSNQVFVRNNPVDPFVEVKVIPTYSGINKAEIVAEINKLYADWLAETDPIIKDFIKADLEAQLSLAKKLIIRSTVTKDTQYVKTSYSDLTNRTELDGTELSQNIGWIDNAPFEYTKNLRSDVPVDANGDPQTEICDEVQCVWDISYPTPNLAGGLYAIDFVGRKGDTEQTLQAPFWIDSNILTEPIIYDIDKIIDNQNQDTRIFDGEYYANSYKVEIKGVADPSTNIQIIDTLTGQTVCTTVTTEINIFSCVADFYPNIPTSKNSLKVIAIKVTKTVESSTDTVLHIDTQAPSLTAFRNLNTNHTEVVTKYLCQQEVGSFVNLAGTTAPTKSVINKLSVFNQTNLTQAPNSVWCDNGSGLPDGFYRQGGDTVEVELEADEQLSYGQITNPGEKFRYKLDPTQNAGNRPTKFDPYTAANGIFQIEGYAPEGVYTVDIEISDRAGNITKTTANYVVDNQTPFSPYQDKNLWGNLTGFGRRVLDQKVPVDPNDSSKGTTNPTGVPANLQPANNRLLETSNQKNYALKDNSVIFFGTAEENTYPILVVNNVDILALQTNPTVCDTKDQNGIERSKLTAPDETITRSNNHCLWQVEVGFSDLYNLLKSKNALNTSSQQTKPGATNPAEGVYLIQYRSEDPSGNRSEYTQQYLLELDQTRPQFFNVTSASSNKFNPIIDWKQNGQTTFYGDGRGNLPAITNQLDLTLNGTTEQLADVEYFLIDNQGQLANSQTLINGKDQKHTINFNLGDKTADRDGQIGLAQDGYYQICYNSADSSDNEIGTSCFVVQRDTLSPVTPNFSANLNFVYKNAPYTISGAVAGEPYTNSSLFGNLGRNGQRGGTLKTLDINNDSDWETTFTFCTNLTDRASNQSPSVCRSVSTPVRPPRDGECSLGDQAKQKYNQIQLGELETDDLYNTLGISRSCQTYEPNLIQDQLGEFEKNLSLATECFSGNINKQLSVEQKPDSIPTMESNYTIMIDYESCAGYEQSIGKETYDYLSKKQDEATSEKLTFTKEALKEHIDEQTQIIKDEIAKAQEELRCDWNIKVWEGKNCVNRFVGGFINGGINAVKATFTMVDSLLFDPLLKAFSDGIRDLTGGRIDPNYQERYTFEERFDNSPLGIINLFKDPYSGEFMNIFDTTKNQRGYDGYENFNFNLIRFGCGEGNYKESEYGFVMAKDGVGCLGNILGGIVTLEIITRAVRWKPGDGENLNLSKRQTTVKLPELEGNGLGVKKKSGLNTTNPDIFDFDPNCVSSNVISPPSNILEFAWAVVNGVEASACGNIKSANQLNKEIQTGKAPKGISRIDKETINSAGIVQEKMHVHFNGDENIALNIDGTWKHKPPNTFSITKAQKDWLAENGWTIPSGY
jgi:hypothetical protein